jgi:hypothetical protein
MPPTSTEQISQVLPQRGQVLWLAQNMTRLVIAKRRLMVRDPLNRQSGYAPVLKYTGDVLYLARIRIVEKSRELETDPRVVRWRWAELENTPDVSPWLVSRQTLCQRLVGGGPSIV